MWPRRTRLTPKLADFQTAMNATMTQTAADAANAAVRSASVQLRADNRDERDVGTSAHAQPPGRRGGKAPTPPAFHRIDRGTHPDGNAAA